MDETSTNNNETNKVTYNFDIVYNGDECFLKCGDEKTYYSLVKDTENNTVEAIFYDFSLNSEITEFLEVVNWFLKAKKYNYSKFSYINYLYYKLSDSKNKTISLNVFKTLSLAEFIVFKDKVYKYIADELGLTYATLVKNVVFIKKMNRASFYDMDFFLRNKE